MARRNILHRNHLEGFIKWLGDRTLPIKGQWEVCRWKGPAGQPMRIVFENERSPEHLSCNDVAVDDVQKFLKDIKIMSDIKLKKCPCCGAEAKVFRAVDTYQVYCSNTQECALKTAGWKQIKYAVDAWNKRETEPAQGELFT